MHGIIKTIFLNARKDKVWPYISRPDKLAAWLMKNDIEPHAGHAFAFTYQPTREHHEGKIACRVVEVDEGSRIAFSWTDKAMGHVETLVTISLAREGGLTKLTLHHTGWHAVPKRDARTADHDQGWDEHLAILKKKLA